MWAEVNQEFEDTQKDIANLDVLRLIIQTGAKKATRRWLDLNVPRPHSILNTNS